MIRWAVLFALLTASPAAAEPISLNQAIELCRITHLIDPKEGRRIFEALPEEQKEPVAAVCLGYLQGAKDMREIMHDIMRRRAK